MKSQQDKLISKLSDKIVLPNMSAQKERMYLNHIYDSCEEFAAEIIMGL